MIQGSFESRWAQRHKIAIAETSYRLDNRHCAGGAKVA
jgi:hypothetical protein